MTGIGSWLRLGAAVRRAPAVALALQACAEPEPPSMLWELTVPAAVRVGTPVQVVGRGLAGRTLRLEGAPVDIALLAAGQRSDGAEIAWGHLPDHPSWRAGMVLGQGCLIGADLANWRACAAASSQFQAQWLPQVLALAAPKGWRWGQLAVLHGSDLLLPGEGTQHAEVEIDGEIRSAPLITRLADGRQRGELAISSQWLGAQPGAKQFRVRVAGQAGAVAIAGPWSPWQQVLIPAPQLQPAGPGWRRGDFVPAVAVDVPGPESWSLRWKGHWLGPAAPGAAANSRATEFLTPGGPDGRSAASSWWWAEQLPSRAPAWQFQGQVQLEVRRGAELWAGPAVAVTAPVLPTVQRVELVGGAGWRSALARFGLAAHAASVQFELVTELRRLFGGWAVQFELVEWPQVDGRETLRLWLGDGDSNGLHLIGADTSLAGAGKDLGNRVLDEQLGGFDGAAWAAGSAPVGGVFVGELLAFSARLHPSSPAASEKFDMIFGLWSPQLGGSVAPASAAQQVRPAVRQLAAAVAEACAHEIGHALGMPAGTADLHRPADQPGWIMDSGGARPWAERAGLAGAPPAQWGPLDAAYLGQILPRSQQVYPK